MEMDWNRQRAGTFLCNPRNSHASRTMHPRCDMLLDEDLWVIYDAGPEEAALPTSRVLERVSSFEEAKALVEFFNRVGLGCAANQR